jgi:hypothetical protein
LPYLGQIQECKDSLLTEEAYTALLQQPSVTDSLPPPPPFNA